MAIGKTDVLGTVCCALAAVFVGCGNQRPPSATALREGDSVTATRTTSQDAGSVQASDANPGGAGVGGASPNGSASAVAAAGEARSTGGSGSESSTAALSCSCPREPSRPWRARPGKLYVADANANTVESVDLANKTVSTIAGTRFESGTGDGKGVAARFYSPHDLVDDGRGTVYVTDSGNNAIGKIVVATGEVTTIAGSRESGARDGHGKQALFQSPRGITRDGRGNLYVTDFNNHTIRKIVAANGKVSTIAGRIHGQGSADGTGGVAQFNGPEGVACDGTNLYVADVYNHTIRRVVLASAQVTTLAGAPEQAGSLDGVGSAARFNQPMDVALDRSGNLYVAGSENHTIRKIVLATGSVTTVVGSLSRIGVQLGALPASLSAPRGLALLSAGDLAIGDEMAVLTVSIRWS